MQDYYDKLLSDNMDFFINHTKKNNKRYIIDNVEINQEVSAIPIPIPLPNLNEVINPNKIVLEEGQKYTKEIEINDDEEVDTTYYEEIYKDLEENEEFRMQQKMNYNEQYKNSNFKIENEFKQNKENMEKIVLIKNIYEYLYDTFYKFSLVYDDLYDKIEDFKKIEIAKKEKPNLINEEIYLKQFRKGNLTLKTNLIAYQIGEYNFKIFINLINKKYLESDKKEEFINDICKIYKGTDIDFLFLKEFEKIVIAESSKLFIFEDTEQNKKKETIIENYVNDNKSILDNKPKEKKDIFNLKPFKLKK